MWVFRYFGNQLCPCDIISTKRQIWDANVLKRVQKQLGDTGKRVLTITLRSGRGKKLLLLPPFWVQLPSPPGWTPRSCCRPLFWGWAAEPTFWPEKRRRKQLEWADPLQATATRTGSRLQWLQLTVLHFSISVLISGLTFSIRSTRFALLFIIPPGMTKTLVPPTDKADSGWLRW